MGPDNQSAKENKRSTGAEYGMMVLNLTQRGFDGGVLVQGWQVFPLVL